MAKTPKFVFSPSYKKFTKMKSIAKSNLGVRAVKSGKFIGIGIFDSPKMEEDALLLNA